MNQSSGDLSLVRSMKPIPLHPMLSTPITHTVMDVLNMKQQNNSSPGQVTRSYPRIVPHLPVYDQYGEEINVQREASLPESTSGIVLLSRVLELLESHGLNRVGSVEVIFDNSGSGIRGVILSFPSGTKMASRGTDGEQTPNTVTQTDQSTQDRVVRVPFASVPMLEQDR